MSELSIPKPISERLDELCSQLKTALGDDLVALLVHGSAVRGDYRKESDVDLVVVLAKAGREQLDALAEPLHVARFAARIEAMILVADEIPRAADVFPIFYADLQRHHVVLHGKDPFAGLVIEDHHLRLRVEQELREAQIRLRRAVTDARGNQDALRGVVGRKLKQVRSTLRVLLDLKGIAVGDGLAEVVAKACATYEVEGAPLTKLAEAPGEAHDALVALLDRAIDDADRMADAAPGPEKAP